jgi:hypothetical protein
MALDFGGTSATDCTARTDSQLARAKHILCCRTDPILILTRSRAVCAGARSHRQSVQAGHHSTIVLAGWSADVGQANSHRARTRPVVIMVGWVCHG